MNSACVQYLSLKELEGFLNLCLVAIQTVIEAFVYFKKPDISVKPLFALNGQNFP